MSSRRIFLYPAIWAFVLMFVSTPAWSMHIEFKSEARVDGSALSLQDVARISPDQAARQYGEIELFRVRSPHAVQIYRASTLRAYILRQIGDKAQITWSGEKEITVRRAGGELIDQHRMQSLVQDYLQEHFDTSAVTHLEFIPGKLPAPFTLPNKNWECTVRPSDQNLLSARSFSLEFRDQRRVLRNVTVRGEVRARASVVVAARNLRRGQTIGREDVNVQQRELNRRVEPLFDLDKVVNKRAVRSIRAESVIDAQKIARPHLVRRRQPVTLIVRKGHMQISASGISQENGSKSERVCVENASSGEEVFGYVVGRDTVEVSF